MSLTLDAVQSKLWTLDNGLRVVVTEQPDLHRTSMVLLVGVGARHETEATNGLSHFLEHMLYRGTADHPSAHQQNLAFESLGGALYAATHADHTHIAVTAPPSSTAELMALLGEVVSRPLLEDIELERGIVREEIREFLDEDGRQVEGENVIREVMFPGHPLGFTITGTIEGLERFDVQMLRAHLARYYVGRNMVLSVAGPCQAEEILRLAQQYLGTLPAGERSETALWQVPRRSVRRRHVSSRGMQIDLRMSYRTPGSRHPMAPAIELLLRVIDDGMSTRLYHRLVDEGGMVYDCSAQWEPFVEVGALDFHATVHHLRVDAVVQSCLEMIDDLREVGPRPDEVEKAKHRQRWDLEATLDDPEHLAQTVGAAVLFERPLSLEALADRYEKLGPREVQEAARHVFRRRCLHVATIGRLTGPSGERMRTLLRNWQA